MATIINQEDILKAVQVMSKDERLKLIAEIASLPDDSGEQMDVGSTEYLQDVDPQIIAISHQVMNKYDDLFQRLASWPKDTSTKTK